MLAKDKILHVALGFGISAATSIAAHYLDLSPWLGFLIAATAGAAKEIRDNFGKGHEDFLDFWWTGLGGVVPSLLVAQWGHMLPVVPQ